jgi:hypothetical protein
VKLTVQPHNRDAFLRAASNMTQIAQGIGWTNTARLMVNMNLDREILKSVSKKRRIRNKRMKTAIRQVFLDSLFHAGLEVRK